MMGDRVCHERRADDILDPRVRRHCHLDMVRVLCMVLVSVDSTNGVFAQYNVFYSQSWVLQLSWVVFGICWALSKKSVFGHLLQLIKYLLLAFAANSMSMLVARVTTTSGPTGTRTQLWFVAALAVYSTATAPLKSALFCARCRSAGSVMLAPHALVPATIGQPSDGEQMEPLQTSEDFCSEACLPREKDGVAWRPVAAGSSSSVAHGVSRKTEARSACLLVAAFQVLVVTQVCVGLQSSSLSTMLAPVALLGCSGERVNTSAVPWRPGLGDGGFIPRVVPIWPIALRAHGNIGPVGTACGVVILAHAGSRLLRSPTLSPWLVWILLLYIYGCRAFLAPGLYGRCDDERLFVGMQLFTVGMTAASMGMKGQWLLGRLLSRYWFLVLGLMALFWWPEWDVRLDELPPTDYASLWRVLASEALCTIGFLVAGEHLFDPRVFTEDVCAWLRDWCLWLFLFHKAMLNLLPTPLYFLLLVAMMPMACWYRKRMGRRRSCP